MGRRERPRCCVVAAWRLLGARRLIWDHGARVRPTRRRRRRLVPSLAPLVAAAGKDPPARLEGLEELDHRCGRSAGLWARRAKLCSCTRAPRREVSLGLLARLLQNFCAAWKGCVCVCASASEFVGRDRTRQTGGRAGFRSCQHAREVGKPQPQPPSLHDAPPLPRSPPAPPAPGPLCVVARHDHGHREGLVVVEPGVELAEQRARRPNVLNERRAHPAIIRSAHRARRSRQVGAAMTAQHTHVTPPCSRVVPARRGEPVAVVLVPQQDQDVHVLHAHMAIAC